MSNISKQNSKSKANKLSNKKSTDNQEKLSDSVNSIQLNNISINHNSKKESLGPNTKR